MHQSSYDKVVDFRNRFLKGRENDVLEIYDIGSQDVNGSYKPIFSAPSWNYKGVDMTSGANVDIVLSNPYRWTELPSKSADIVVSGQTFEHITNIWAAILEVDRILKPGGLCCIVAPSSGPEHRYPVDCWRIYPDGFAFLAELAGLDLIETQTQWEDLGYKDGSDVWHDSVLICRSPHLSLWKTIKKLCKRKIQHHVLTWRAK